MNRFRGRSYLFLGLLIMIGTLTYIYNFKYQTDDDAGSYLYYSWRISEGDTMYLDLPPTYQPVALYFVGFIFKLFGVSAFAAKLTTLIITLFCLVLVYLIGTELNNEWVGLISGTLFLFSPDIIFYSSMFYLEPYYLFFILVGLLLSITAVKYKKNHLHLFAGLSYGLAIETKLLALFPIAGIYMFLLYSSFKEGLKDFDFKRFIARFSWLSAGILFIVAAISFYFLAKGGLYKPPLLTNFSIKSVCGAFLKYAISNAHIVILVLISLPIFVTSFKKKDEITLLSFYFASIFLFFIYPRDPFFSRFFYFIVPTISLLAGLTIFKGMQLFLNDQVYKIILAFYILVFVCFSLAAGLKSKDFSLSPKESEQEVISRTAKNLSSVLSFINTNSVENDYILADHGNIPFFSKRKNVPLSQDLHAVTVNLIALEEFKEKIEEFKPKIIIIVNEGMDRHLPTYKRISELTTYILQSYSLVEEFSPEYSVYILM